MTFHCRCGIKEAECDYPNCKNGEWDAQKPEPHTAQAVHDVLAERRRQAMCCLVPVHVVSLRDAHGMPPLAEADGASRLTVPTALVRFRPRSGQDLASSGPQLVKAGTTRDNGVPFH